jgi:DNA polymerase III delta prime subunit
MFLRLKLINNATKKIVVSSKLFKETRHSSLLVPSIISQTQQRHYQKFIKVLCDHYEYVKKLPPITPAQSKWDYATGKLKILAWIVLGYLLYEYYKALETTKDEGIKALPELTHDFYRTQYSDHLKALLNNSNNKEAISMVAICGPSGLGKTALALNYAYEQAKSGEISSLVWFFNATSSVSLEESYRNFAKHLSIPSGQHISIEQVVTAVRLKLLQNPGFLLVFDNVGDNTDIEKYLPTNTGYDKIANFFQKVQYGELNELVGSNILQGKIVLTSKKKSTINLTGLRTLTLTGWRIHEECLPYMNQLLGDKQNQYPEAEKIALAIKLGGSPLALHIAVSQLKIAAHLTIKDYLKTLENGLGKLQFDRLPTTLEEADYQNIHTAVIGQVIAHLKQEASNTGTRFAYKDYDNIASIAVSQLKTDLQLKDYYQLLKNSSVKLPIILKKIDYQKLCKTIASRTNADIKPEASTTVMPFEYKNTYKLLRFMAFLGSYDIPATLLKDFVKDKFQIQDDIQFIQLLSALKELGLIQTSNYITFAIHEAIQQQALAADDTIQDWNQAVKFLATQLDDNFVFKASDTVKEKLIHHTRIALQYSPKSIGDELTYFAVARLKIAIGSYLMQQGLAYQAPMLLSSAKEMLEFNRQNNLLDQPAKQICDELASIDKTLPTVYAHALYMLSRTYFYQQEGDMPSDLEKCLETALDMRDIIDVDKKGKYYIDSQNIDGYTQIYKRSGKALLLLLHAERITDETTAKTYIKEAKELLNQLINLNPSFALFNFTADDVTELKSLVGHFFGRVNTATLENSSYKKISFTANEILDIQSKLADINTENAKKLSDKLLQKRDDVFYQAACTELLAKVYLQEAKYLPLFKFKERRELLDKTLLLISNPSDCNEPGVIERLLKDKPNDYNRLGKFYNMLGDIYLVKGDLQAAEAAYKQCLKIEQGKQDFPAADAHLGLAKVYFYKLDEETKAQQHIKENLLIQMTYLRRSENHPSLVEARSWKSAIEPESAYQISLKV